MTKILIFLQFYSTSREQNSCIEKNQNIKILIRTVKKKCILCLTLSMLIVANKLHFMVLFGSSISVLIKHIHEKLVFLSHKLLFFASFSSLLFVLSFFLLFSHHGSISKQNTFMMDMKNNYYYFLNLKSDCPGEKDQCW